MLNIGQNVQDLPSLPVLHKQLLQSKSATQAKPIVALQFVQ